MPSETIEKKFRDAVVGANRKVPLLSGKHVTAINFDNAATTPPLCSVMRELNEFMPWYSSVHRGTGYKSMLSSDLYENSRHTMKSFVGADDREDTVVYTKSATEAVNLLAYALYQQYPDAIVLSTRMEHLSNDLPWRKFGMDYIAIDGEGRLDLNDLEYKLAKYRGRVRLVSVTGASNVTGYVNPVHGIAALAHQYGAKIFVDGAQYVPHCRVDMKRGEAEPIDYLAFSAHKMYAPFGAGALIGSKRVFAGTIPLLQGGGDVRLVGKRFVDWDEAPYKEEAGTPNLVGVQTMLEAVKELQRLDMEEIHAHEYRLIQYIIQGLKRVPGIRLFGCGKGHPDKVSIISFTLPELEHRTIAKILSYEYGIAVRSGLFCAHPYVQGILGLSDSDVEYYRAHPELSFPGLVRVSLGMYNTRREADVLLEAVRQIEGHCTEYREKYKNLERLPEYRNSPLLNAAKRWLP